MNDHSKGQAGFARPAQPSLKNNTTTSSSGTSTFAGYKAWHKALMDDPDLRELAVKSRRYRNGGVDIRLVALEIASHGANGISCFAEAKTVGDAIGCSRETIERLRRDLLERGWFTVVSRTGGDFKRSLVLSIAIGGVTLSVGGVMQDDATYVDITRGPGIVPGEGGVIDGLGGVMQVLALPSSTYQAKKAAAGGKSLPASNGQAAREDPVRREDRQASPSVDGLLSRDKQQLWFRHLRLPKEEGGKGWDKVEAALRYYHEHGQLEMEIEIWEAAYEKQARQEAAAEAFRKKREAEEIRLRSVCHAAGCDTSATWAAKTKDYGNIAAVYCDDHIEWSRTHLTYCDFIPISDVSRW